MESTMKWLSADVPTGWADAFLRAVKTAVVGFMVLQAKEWFDVGRFDTTGTATDALSIAGGVFLMYSIQRVARSSTSP